MAAEPKKVPAVFYRTSMGTEPVRDWIKGLSATDRKIIGEDIATVERGWPIGMPVCRPLSKGLWEVRSSITGGIGRILFCVFEDQMYLLNAFVKKTQKTPQAEIDLARKRKREIGNEQA